MTRDEMRTKTSDNVSKNRGYAKIQNTTINLIRQHGQSGLAMTRDDLDAKTRYTLVGLQLSIS